MVYYLYIILYIFILLSHNIVSYNSLSLHKYKMCILSYLVTIFYMCHAQGNFFNCRFNLFGHYTVNRNVSLRTKANITRYRQFTGWSGAYRMLRNHDRMRSVKISHRPKMRSQRTNNGTCVFCLNIIILILAVPGTGKDVVSVFRI